MFTGISPVYAFQTDVEPRVLKQGDAFALIIYSESSVEPEAYFGKRKLYFNKIGDGIFKAVSAINLNTKPGPYRSIFDRDKAGGAEEKTENKGK